MTLQEFQEITEALGKIKSGTVDGFGPVFEALETLSVLRDRVHPEDRDKIEIGIPPRGAWYVNIHSDERPS